MSNNSKKILLNDLLDRVNSESPIWNVVLEVKEIINNATEINVVTYSDTDEIKTEELRHTYSLRLKKSKILELSGFSESCESLTKTSVKQLKLIIVQTERFVITIWYSNVETVCCFYRDNTGSKC
jgi:hypothetical protein